MTDEPIDVNCNDKEIFEALEALSKRAKNLKPVMREISHSMLNAVEENFETEGKSGSGKWEGWSKSWAQKRKDMGKDGKILTLNADLRNSLTRQATADKALVGTNKEYAAIHNFGGPVKKRVKKGQGKGANGTFDMLQREFMLWTKSLEVDIESTIWYKLKVQEYKDADEAKLRYLKGE